MTTLIQIRGTSGSGKSTVVRKFMETITGWVPEYRPGRKKPILYRAPDGIVVLGHYESPCGGCDTIGSAAAVAELVGQLLRNGMKPKTIVCEGLLLSEDTKWTLKLAEEGVSSQVLFLTTPIDECVQRIKGRRAEAGNDKPLSESNTRNRVKAIEGARNKLSEAGVRCRRCSCGQSQRIIQSLVEVQHG